MWQRLPWDHLFAHRGVVDKDGLHNRDLLQVRGLQPLGTFRGFAVAGCEPDEMGIGPVFAVPKLLARQGLGIDDIDVWELNEAFASQVLYCRDRLGIPQERLNRDAPVGLELVFPVYVCSKVLLEWVWHAIELVRPGDLRRNTLVTLNGIDGRRQCRKFWGFVFHDFYLSFLC